eukprot:CAMPEP_0119040380 /NCGR_PEP_ID=MMETSP1177-20130426/10294_1 /TAXON_ID=2985 /ORGANISM="Ochromonas sp, Strain CCMP1899" /LENGTH=93 /DNA_ID=CAMNT_0007005381 /DNA_START=1552 /DNA_END=1830 /DNA_ORIENTATION=+
MSRTEFLFSMWNAQSLGDCWRILKEGRHHVVDVSSDSTQYLIAPTEEREKFLSKAFITFKTFTSATVARQVVHMQLVGHMAISEAPETTDITW